jgi:alpha-beta hydrolase superfamily lysophospholipase
LSTTDERANAAPTPMWFGPDERPLFGWLHLPPDRQVRGGVVLCQPLGLEALCTYYSYRLLAERLAELGVAVLRFDYDGTGDSVGHESEPDRTDAWLGSLAVATDHLAGLGVGPIGLVGIRLGALFAAQEASRRGGVDTLVLWDPCLTGRAYLREQRFLRQVSGEADRAEDDAVEAPGIRFEPETVKSLSDVDLKGLPGDLATRVLALVPPGVSRPKALERRLAGLDTEWQVADGQTLMLDSSAQVPPYETIERVATWVSGSFSGIPVAVSPPPPSTGVVGHTASGAPIVERMVSLGSLDLFGIVTEGPDTAGRPTVILVNEGGTHHIGQARIWVDLGRRLAELDFRVLRFDLSGNGDSEPRPGQIPHVARAFEAIEDVQEAIAAIAPDDTGDVVLIGFCSGGYQVVEQALIEPPRAIYVINPTFIFEPTEPAGSVTRPARQVPKTWFTNSVTPVIRAIGRRRSAEELRRWVKAVEVGTWPVSIAHRYPGIPDRVWGPVHRLLFERRGVDSLATIAGSGVETVLIVGPHDLQPISLGAERRFDLLAQDPRFHLVQLDELEHASWTLDQRRLIISVIAEHMNGAFGTSPAAPPTGH